MSRLKKQAKTLGNFKNYELNKIQEVIDYLESKRNMLAGVAERSSNFEEAFTKLYEATNDLQQGLELEKTDNIY